MNSPLTPTTIDGAGLAEYADMVRSTLATQAGQGATPWQRTWPEGERFMPYNPATGQSYRGINAVWLKALESERGYDDSRWLTERQIIDLGAPLPDEAAGARVVHWQTREKRIVDARGDRPPQVQTVTLEQPRIWCATVFNAAELRGLVDVPRAAPAIDAGPRLEDIFALAAGQIAEVADVVPAYDPITDRIVMPARATFLSAAEHDAALLRQVLHWTGHASRLNRDLSHPPGSASAAREEMRMGIAALIVGDRLQMGYQGGVTDLYSTAWQNALTQDPKEIFRAATQGGVIAEKVVSLAHEQAQSVDAGVETAPDTVSIVVPGVPEVGPIVQMPVMLAVTAADREAAGALGAEVDGETGGLYVPAGVPLDAFKQWLPEASRTYTPPVETPKDAFARVCREMGLVVGDPEMDGTLRRVPVKGDKGSERSGAYTGHTDGRPAGFIQNHRTGEKCTWKYEGVVRSQVSRGQAAAQQAAARTQRDEQQSYIQMVAAQAAAAAWDLGASAPADHRYLVRKQVEAHGLRIITKESATVINRFTQRLAEHRGETFKTLRIEGNLMVPLRDSEGTITTLQNISGPGFKGFMKGARLTGSSFVMGDLGNTSPLVIAEGYATGAKLHEATDLPTVVAFIADNLKSVAKAYRAQFPDRMILIAGDNDHQKPFELDPNGKPKVNKGKMRAEEAAREVGGHALLPSFSRDDPSNDWNDLLIADHAKAMRQWDKGYGRAAMLESGQRLEQARHAPEHAVGVAGELEEKDLSLDMSMA